MTSTYLVVIPKIAVIHIQNIAAGPPVHIASATPPIFPVPTAPDIAVVSAWNPVVSPSDSEVLALPDTIFKALLKYLN